MSFVTAAPEMLATAAQNVANIGTSLSAANATAAASTTSVLAAGADEVSQAIARLFSDYATHYQSLNAQAAAFHHSFVQTLNAAGGAYSSAEAANASAQALEQNLLAVINAPAQALFGRPLIGNGANGTAASPNGGDGGILYGNGGNGFSQTTAGLIGTIGIRVGGADLPSALTTPEAPTLQAMLAAMVERGVDTVVMEVSSHALALGRVDGTRFAVGAFTNLSRDHLDFHPSMADYFEAKASLFDPDSALRARTAVVCIDDDAGRAMAARAADAITVSAADRPAHWRATDVAPTDAGGQQFTAIDPAGVGHHIGIRLPGRYNVANCLVALAILDTVGVSPEQAVPGLREIRVPGRLEQIDRGQGFLALVDYAHKPEALRSVLTTLAHPDRRLAVVFGAGGDRDPGKRAPMGRIAAQLADLVVVTDDNPRDEDPTAIRREILAGAAEVGGDAQVVEIADRRDAIRHAVAWARPGDVVLIAGKGHETGQRGGGRVRPFDDRVELAAALEALERRA